MTVDIEKCKLKSTNCKIDPSLAAEFEIFSFHFQICNFGICLKD
jgi:hypothetical protein